MLPRLFALPPLAVTTVVGLLDRRRVSISSELKTFLLSMCVDAQDSTTNSLSSGFFEEGAGITQAPMRTPFGLVEFFAVVRDFAVLNS